MFKKHVFGLTLLWVMSVCVCFWIFRTFSPDAQMTYHRLINFSDQVKIDQIKENLPPAQQTRERISKQIFHKKDSQRLQSRLVSEHSDLILESKGKGTQVVEHFKGMTCAMQEKLILISREDNEKGLAEGVNGQCKQYIRYLKAREAIYFYKTGQLEAEEVEVAHYLVPGLFWPVSLETFPPLFQGQAQKLQLSIFKEPHLKAQGFQANFYQWSHEW